MLPKNHSDDGSSSASRLKGSGLHFAKSIFITILVQTPHHYGVSGGLTCKKASAPLVATYTTLFVESSSNSRCQFYLL